MHYNQAFLKTLLLMVVLFIMSSCFALNKHPISPLDNDPLQGKANGFQSLVYGGSTSIDVQKAIGKAPDFVVKDPSMFPVIENDIYSDHDGTNAAMVFVFQNNLLAGVQYRTRDNQFIDLTYLLPNNGDGTLNSRLAGGAAPYYFDPRFYVTPLGSVDH